eukprot:gene32616-41465_t
MEMALKKAGDPHPGFQGGASPIGEAGMAGGRMNCRVLGGRPEDLSLGGQEDGRRAHDNSAGAWATGVTDGRGGGGHVYEGGMDGLSSRSPHSAHWASMGRSQLDGTLKYISDGMQDPGSHPR